MKTWKIYKHTLLIGEHNGWSYIGLSCRANLNDRWQNGKGYWSNNKDSAFYNAIQKYGWENFSHEILEDNINSIELANERESYWISYYHTYIHDPECAGYNMTLGGDGSYGYKHSNEIKNKISEQTKIAMSNLKLNEPDKFKAGYNKAIQSHKEFFEFQKANNTDWYINWCKHLSEASKGKPKTEAHKEKLRQANLGKKTSEETKAKLSQVLTTSNNVHRKKVLCVETGEVFESITKANTWCGSTHVGACCLGNQKTCKGYHWCFVE